MFEHLPLLIRLVAPDRQGPGIPSMISIQRLNHPESKRTLAHPAGLAALLVILICSLVTFGQSGSSKPELVLQTGHTAPINAIALSGDGRFLVSGSDDNTLKVWDTSSGNVLRTLYGHAQAVMAIAISPDSRLIASGSEDFSLRVWDAGSGEARVFGQHSGPIREVAFSGDSRQLVSLSNGELKVWEVSSGREIHVTRLSDDKNTAATQVSGPAARFNQAAAALSADGRLAAVGGGTTYKAGVLGFGGGARQKPIRIVEPATGREIESLKLKGDHPYPNDLSFSPDARLLAAKFTELNAGRDNSSESSVVIFDVATGREVKTFRTGDVYGTGGIAFSPDGKLLASRVSVGALDPAHPPTSAASFPSGSIRLIEASTWREVRELTKTGFEIDLARGLTSSPLCFSGDGKTLAASLGNGVALFDSASGSPLRVLKTREREIAPSAQSPSAARDAALRQAGIDPDQMRQIQEMAGGALGPNSPFGGVQGALIGTGSSVTFSPDGKQLTSSGSTTVWDMASGTPRTGPRVNANVMELFQGAKTAYSPDGKLVAGLSLSDNGASIVVKEVASGQLVRRIPVGSQSSGQQRQVAAQISSLAFGARGIVVQYCEIHASNHPSIFGGAGGSQECRIKTFDPDTGKELRDFKLDSPGGGMMFGFFNASALSPNGRYLVALTPDSGGGGGFGGFRPSLPRLPRMGGRGGAPKQTFKIKLTDLDSGRKIWEIKTESENMGNVPSFNFSPNGNVLAVTNYEKSQPAIDLYDAASGRRLGSLNSGDHRIARMNFSSDGTLLATSYGDVRPSMVLSRAPVGKPNKSAADAGDSLVTIWDVSAAKPAFTLAHDAPVSGVAFSPSRKLIVTQTRDLNLHVWDMQNGEKLLTLVNLDMLYEGGGSEWLVVTPDGLFDGSPAAWQQIMWRFSQNTFDIGPVEIFFNDLFYPGLLSDVFSGKRPRAPRDIQQLDRRQPRVTVTPTQPAGGDVRSRTIAVRVDVAEAPADAAHPNGSGVRDVRLFRNGALVKLWRGDVLKGQPSAILETNITAVAGENRLTAYAFNQDNVKSADAAIVLTGSPSLRRQGTAYVVAFGVNEYANPQYNLKYAGADAADFAEEVKAQQMKLGEFARVEVISLLDRDATKANLLLALQLLTSGTVLPAGAPRTLSALQRAEPEDAVVIYFAGHGTAHGPRFYLVPHDLGYTGPRAGIDAAAIDTILGHSVSDLEIEAAVEGLDAGQMLLVIDACNSGQALEAEEKRRGPMNSKGLAQLAYEKGLYILTAAQSYQAAMETAQLGHGYLTFALIEEGLKRGLADREQKDGQVLVREWFNYAAERVPEMQEQNTNSRLLLEEDDKSKSGVRNLQRPRAFYRREPEPNPLVVGKP